MSSVFRRRSAGPVFVLIEAGQAFLFGISFTLAIVYQIQTAHLDALQLVLIGTVLEVTLFIGEIPTGVVADLYSRRLSVIIGVALIGLSVLLTGLFPTFGMIALAQVVWGIGYTFTSGATEAWLADEVGADAAQVWFTRSTQWSLVGTFAGTLTAGALGVISLTAPFMVGGSLYLVLAVILCVVMGETNFTATERVGRTAWKDVTRLAGDGLRVARRVGVVRVLLIVGVLEGLASEVFDRLWTDRVLRDFDLPALPWGSAPAVWFTSFALIGTAIAFIASRVANRVAARALRADHPARVLALLTGLRIAAVAGFAVTPNLWGALGFFWLRDAAATVDHPVRRAWLNRNVDSRTRATTLSALGQADAVGQIAGGPIFGAVAAAAGVSLAMVASAVAQLPALPLLARLRPATPAAEASE